MYLLLFVSVRLKGGIELTRFVNRYYVTLIFFSLLTIFSIPLTQKFSQNIKLYFLMYIVVILFTLIMEYFLNRTHDIKDKNKRMLFTVYPLALILIFAFMLHTLT